MNEREKRFVRAYLAEAGGNATKAAILAGYKPTNAASQASRLLTKADVRAALEAKAAQADLTTERILKEVSRIAFSDVRQWFDEHGHLRPINELPDDAAKALASVEVTKESNKDGTYERVTKVKAWDKLKALELAGRYLNVWQDKHSGAAGLTVNIGFIAQPDSRLPSIQVMSSPPQVSLVE